jgi:hypothetical protein
MRTDQSSTKRVLPCINPGAAITGNATTTGATIDSAGFESLTFVVQTGVITDGTFAGQVWGGNAANMSDEVQLTAAELIGSNIAIAATDDNVCERVGANIHAVAKRYYRLKMVQAGATSGGVLAANAILENPRFAPTVAP